MNGIQTLSCYEQFGDDMKARIMADNSPLFLHQKKCIETVVQHLSRRAELQLSRRGTAVLPTGCGKTAVALALPYVLKSKRVLVVTPRDALRSQFYEAATDSFDRPNSQSFFTRTGLIKADESAVFGNIVQANDAKDLFNNLGTRTMTIANAQMFTDRENQTRDEWAILLPPATYDLVIVDEAHFHPATTWQKINNHFSLNPTGCNIVYLTATPYRTDLKPVCEPDEFCYQFLRSAAVQQGIIRDVESIMFGYSTDDEQKIEQDESNEDRIKNLAVLRAIKETLDDHDLRFPLPDGRKHRALMMVAPPSKNADQLEIDARHALPKCAKAYYTGKGVGNNKLTDSQRETLKDKFKKIPSENDNSPRVLIVNHMLKEGFDFNSVSVVGVSRQFLNDGPAFEQFIGRAVRTFRDAEPPGLTAKFVWHEHDDLAERFAQYRNDRVVKINRQ